MRRFGLEIKRIAADEGASTSVLVVLMMCVLVTLGAFSVSAAYANQVLGGKSDDWNTSYYEIEKMAETLLSDVDGVLINAQRSAGGDGERYLQRAEKNLKSLMSKHSGLKLTATEGGSGRFIKVTRDFSLPGKNYRLLAELEISASGATEGTKRYDIVTWKQWQEDFAFEEPIEFWDGTFEGEE